MYRRRLIQALGGVTAIGVFGHAAAGAQHDDRDLRRRREAAPLDVTVTALESDPEAGNFEEEFTYWVVEFDLEYVDSEYREPARSGPDVLFAGAWQDAFWLGVSGPDEDGIQHEIVHRGQVQLMLEDPEGDWYEIRAQFDGQGNLVHVNGETP